MRTLAYFVVVVGLLLGVIIAGMGCAGGTDARSSGNPSKQARLLEEENYRLSEQVKSLEKEVADLKTAAAAAQEEWKTQADAADKTITFMMEQNKEKDAEIQKLQEKLAGMGNAGAK